MFTKDDVKQRYQPDWMVLGDNSRSDFLNWLLQGNELSTDGNSAIRFRYGAEVSISRQDGYWLVETPELLPKITLCCPPTNDFEGTADAAEETKYIVLEGVPFRQDESTKLIRSLKERGKETLVVLMDLPRHQGSTDTLPPGEDLKLALKEYRAEHHNVLQMKSADDLHTVLHWHTPMYYKWARKVRNDFDEMKDRISFIIDTEYPLLEKEWENDGCIMSLGTQHRLFNSYSTCKRESGKSLWDRYAAVTVREIFNSDKAPLSPVAEMYKDCLDNNPLVFWDLEADVNGLMDSLHKSFIQTLEKEEAKGGYRRKTILPEPFDEDSFLNIVARSEGSGTALNAVYRRIIKKYLCLDVRSHLKERLHKRCQQLEDMLQNYQQLEEKLI